MDKRRKRAPKPVALMCKNDESKVVREFLAKIGDKWSILLVVMLARTPQNRARFSELQRMVDGISQRKAGILLPRSQGLQLLAPLSLGS